MDETAELLKALAAVKAVFQARTIETVIHGGCVRSWWDGAAGEMRSAAIPLDQMLCEAVPAQALAASPTPPPHPKS